MRPKNFRESTRMCGIHLDAIKTHNIPDNIDQLLIPTQSVQTVFSAAPCSFDLQTTVLCYNFNLDKDLYPRCYQKWHLQSCLDTQIAVYPSTFQLPTKK